MKKEYIKPSMEETAIETQAMIATSPGGNVDIYDKTTDKDAEMGNDRRGGWGNLWD